MWLILTKSVTFLEDNAFCYLWNARGSLLRYLLFGLSISSPSRIELSFQRLFRLWKRNRRSSCLEMVAWRFHQYSVFGMESFIFWRVFFESIHDENRYVMFLESLLEQAPPLFAVLCLDGRKEDCLFQLSMGCDLVDDSGRQ